VKAYRTPKDDDQRRAAQFNSLNAECWGELLPLLKHPSPKVRRAILLGLGQLRLTENVDQAVRELLVDPEEPIRSTAFYILAGARAATPQEVEARVRDSEVSADDLARARQYGREIACDAELNRFQGDDLETLRDGVRSQLTEKRPRVIVQFRWGKGSYEAFVRFGELEPAAMKLLEGRVAELRRQGKLEMGLFDLFLSVEEKRLQIGCRERE